MFYTEKSFQRAIERKMYELEQEQRLMRRMEDLEREIDKVSERVCRLERELSRTEVQTCEKL